MRQIRSLQSRPGRRRLATVAFATALVAACGSGDATDTTDAADDPDAFEPTEFQLAVYTAQHTTHGRALQWWVGRIGELTGEVVEIDAHYSGALLPAVDTRDAVADGRVHLGYMSPAYTITDFPLTMVAEMPFISTHMPAHMMAVKELYDESEDVRDEWRNQGVHILAVMPVTNNTMAFREPVETLDDLRGKDIRGIGRSSLLLRAAGANPRDIAYPEVYESLQRGVVDAASGVAYESTYFDRFFEVAPHIVGTNAAGLGINALVIGTNLWDSLPEGVQDALTQASDEMMERMPEFQAEADAETCEAILEAGGTVSTLPESEVQRWEAAADNVVFNDWRASAESAGVADPDGFYELYVETLLRWEDDLGEFLTGPEVCESS